MYASNQKKLKQKKKEKQNKSVNAKFEGINKHLWSFSSAALNLQLAFIEFDGNIADEHVYLCCAALTIRTSYFFVVV